MSSFSSYSLNKIFLEFKLNDDIKIEKVIEWPTYVLHDNNNEHVNLIQTNSLNSIVQLIVKIKDTNKLIKNLLENLIEFQKCFTYYNILSDDSLKFDFHFNFRSQKIDSCKRILQPTSVKLHCKTK